LPILRAEVAEIFKDGGERMSHNQKNILLISMPFAGIAIPSIQLPILEGYLKERNINIKTRHLYLKAAEFYGLNNYNFLINSPNDSYSAQMIFSKYVFPKHWKKTEDKFRKYFDKQMSGNSDIQKKFTFENYVKRTDKFYDWAIKNVDWNSYDLIGFTLNYGQFLPSLAIAKKIKGMYPDKKIIFGGSRTVDKLGIKVLESFDYVDFIVSGDGEDSLYLLASDYQNYKSIPHLIYRNGKKAVWNKSDDIINLDDLPILSYDPFYEELGLTSGEIREYFHLYGRLPIEISRGCWWNKCSFCNISVQHNRYREKNVDRIIEEINFLSDKYKMLTFQIIGNTLLKKDYRLLLEKVKNLGRNFTFFVEARAGQLKSEDYVLLKEAGFTTIQTGIEAFSQNYLGKMNKGARVIDNIASLKFCKETGIDNRYNIIVNYPNEEKIDFEETRKNIQLFKQYLDPPQISFFTVGFGSPIYNNPKEFNIERLEYANIDKIMFPREFLEMDFNFIYHFKRKKDLGENDWEQLVADWRGECEKSVARGMKRQMGTDKLAFYFADGGNFLKIYDKRNAKSIRIYILDEVEREIFLSCIDVISFQELQKRFLNIPENELASILRGFEESGIVFREDESYLSLPLRCSLVSSSLSKKEPQRHLHVSSVQCSL